MKSSKTRLAECYGGPADGTVTPVHLNEFDEAPLDFFAFGVKYVKRDSCARSSAELGEEPFIYVEEQILV